VGCVVGDGCAPLVAEGDGLAVGDPEGAGVFCVPVVDAMVGVFPCVVVDAVDPFVGTLAVCDCDCFML
jgi:hypothetical protein